MQHDSGFVRENGLYTCIYNPRHAFVAERNQEQPCFTELPPFCLGITKLS